MTRLTFKRASEITYKLERPMNKPRRLLELLLCIVPADDPDYLDPVEPAVFAVVDIATGERGLFAREPHTTDEVIDGMVASFFNVTPRRVAVGVWAA